MAAGTIEEALKITLADFRLSRGEKRALAGVIEKLAQDDHRLALARHHAFKIARKELTSPDAVAVVDWLEEVVKLLLPKDVAEEEDTSEAYFQPRRQLRRPNRAVIRNLAEESGHLCLYNHR